MFLSFLLQSFSIFFLRHVNYKTTCERTDDANQIKKINYSRIANKREMESLMDKRSVCKEGWDYTNEEEEKETHRTSSYSATLLSPWSPPKPSTQTN